MKLEHREQRSCKFMVIQSNYMKEMIVAVYFNDMFLWD